MQLQAYVSRHFLKREHKKRLVKGAFGKIRYAKTVNVHRFLRRFFLDHLT